MANISSKSLDINLSKIAFIDDEVCRLEESVLVGEDFD